MRSCNKCMGVFQMKKISMKRENLTKFLHQILLFRFGHFTGNVHPKRKAKTSKYAPPKEQVFSKGDH